MMPIRELKLEELVLVAGGNEGNGGDQGGTGSMGGGDGQGNGASGSADGGYGFSIGASLVENSVLNFAAREIASWGIQETAKAVYEAFSAAITSGKFGTGAAIQGGDEASSALGPGAAGGFDPGGTSSYGGGN